MRGGKTPKKLHEGMASRWMILGPGCSIRFSDRIFFPIFFSPQKFHDGTGGKWQRDLRPARFALCRTSGSRLEGGGGKSSFYWPKINGDFSGVIKLPILGGSNNTNLW